MTEPTLADVQPQDSNQGTGQTEAPASPWANYLTDLPDSVKPLVEPIFKKWDGDVTQRFQTVHSEYEPLKPFQQVVDSGWGFDDVQQALTLAATLNENPQAVYDALVQHYGFGAAPTEQGQSDTGLQQPEEVDPRFARLEQMTEAMAQIMQQQQAAQQAAMEDAQLAQQLSTLKSQHGEFDDEYVMTKVYAGATWDQAIKSYQDLVGKVAQNRPADPPVIMGAGGGLPSQAINPATMSDKDRKALVAQLIARHQAE